MAGAQAAGARELAVPAAAVAAAAAAAAPVLTRPTHQVQRQGKHEKDGVGEQLAGKGEL